MQWRGSGKSGGRAVRRVARGECGGSVVMFVVALPLLLVFLFAVVDLGRTVFLYMALDDAAHAACRAASGLAAGEASRAELEHAALAASPGLKSDALHLDVSASYGELEEASYAHRWYDESIKGFVELPSIASRRTVEVECVLRGAYLTPLGKVLSLAEGEGSSFVYEVCVQGVCDETIGGSSR